MNNFHKAVLLEESIELLRVKRGDKYIDATLGGGGHTRRILDLGGEVLGIDQDPEAIEHMQAQRHENLKVVKGNFSHIHKIAKESGFSRVSGIIFDLGASSHQLDAAYRGFSFSKNGPLDMRMDPGTNVTAEDLVNNLEERRLNEIFETFGQEKLSRPITSAISSARQIKRITKTQDLREIVREVYSKYRVRDKHIGEATRVFQALRIVVNSEILNLKEALPQTTELLEPGGRLVVISFHSLEDATVKRFFKQEEELKVITKKPIGPGTGEIQKNPRSRSAKLRAAEKI